MGEIIVKPIHNVFKQYRKVNLVNPYVFSKPFESTWNTNNISTGSSTATQVKLPLPSTGTYNMIVSWGDGSSSTITAYNQAAVTHTYAVAGTYTIKITGTCIGWQFNNTGDRLKFLSVKTWGNLRLGNLGAYFFGCSNLNLTAVEDILNLTGTTRLSQAFASCTITTINRLNEWDTSTITTFDSCFSGDSSFNQNIGNWNVSNAIVFDSIFASCSSFNNGGSSSINNWVLNTTAGINMANMFSGCTVFNQPLNLWNTSRVITMSTMFRTCNAFNQNISSWNMSLVQTIDNMFWSAISFNQDVSSWVLTSCTNISFVFNGATNFTNAGVSLNSWNVSGVTNMNSAFRLCKYNSPLNLWSTSNVTNMGSMFESNTLFNQSVSTFNVTKVTSFLGMFNGATAFNNSLASGISGTLSWTINTTSNVTMDSMFKSAVAFNQTLPWDMSKVTTVASMFQGCTKFNGVLNNWNLPVCTTFANTFHDAIIFNNGLGAGVSGVMSWTLNTTTSVNMTQMFQGAKEFNQDISSWNTSRVVTMSNMFNMFQVPTGNKFNNGGSSLINGWNTSLCTNMGSMFGFNSAFNQPIGSWNTANVTTMDSMFRSAIVFNQDLSLWNVTKVTDFTFVFNSATAFNNGGSPNINNWVLNTTSAIIMPGMFNAASAFNQPLNLWNTSRVTNMNSMFNGTGGSILFNQNIGDWNVSNVTDFFNFMNGKTPATLSTVNLDAIYNGWSSRPVKPSLTTVHFGTAKRTAASTEGKALLTRALGTKTVSNAVNNGSGLIRITATAHGLTTGNKILISGVVGTTVANNAWNVTVIDANTIDLQGSTFSGTYVSGGTIQTGNAWAITDGGI